MTRKHAWGTALYYLVTLLIAFIAMVPFVWMISTSLKTRGALMSIPIEWVHEHPTLDAYQTVFERFPFFQTILNSLFISVSYTVLTLLSASLAAYAFTKIRFRGSGLVLGLYLATMMIPTQVTMIPLFVVMNQLGLIHYETHRTSQTRLLKFSHSENDADDANDADIDITQLSGWDISKIASQASLASSAKPWRGKYGA